MIDNLEPGSMQNNNTVFGLKELVHPLSTEEFISSYWLTNKPGIIRSDPDGFPKLSFLSEICTLEAFAIKYPGRVSLISRDHPAFDVQGGVEALSYLENGYTIYFRDIENYLPSIQSVTKRLAEDFGVPFFTAEIFASSGVSGVPMHSDYHLNISLLLSGTRKEWTYAENTALRNQTAICLPANKRQIEQSQLQYIGKEPLANKMPESAVMVIQHPGDLIFMPRGWWHSTHSFGDCVSINFIMKKPNWAHLFAIATEKDLLTNHEWRAYPHGVAANDKRKKLAIDELTKLIEQYKKHLQSETSYDTAVRLVQKYLES